MVEPRARAGRMITGAVLIRWQHAQDTAGDPHLGGLVGGVGGEQQKRDRSMTNHYCISNFGYWVGARN